MNSNQKFSYLRMFKGLLNSKWTKDREKGEIFDDVLKISCRSIPRYIVNYDFGFCKRLWKPQNRPEFWS